MSKENKNVEKIDKIENDFIRDFNRMIKKIHKKDYEGAIKAIKGETEEESE
ncbi:MAG: hypothetical protein J5779_01245 [Clostridia bacterium]|nr:hypothetical protein [Clostridia bacterium]